MTYLKWRCSCGHTFFSISGRTHTLNSCKECGSYVDYDEYYTRCGGKNPEKIQDSFEVINMNFFDELVLGAKEQEIPFNSGYHEVAGIMFRYVDFSNIRKIEDEIVEDLK